MFWFVWWNGTFYYQFILAYYISRLPLINFVIYIWYKIYILKSASQIISFCKVFKARFFPNCSIMEATNSRSGSYAWRSILIGRDVLQRGARWRVGSGEKIKIWQHHWLPRKHPPQVTSYPLESFENTTVATLIDSTTRCLNEEQIDGLFAPSEAEI